MCDDYDTDYDSEHEEFDRTNLIDDIQRINLALGADSDNSEEEEEEEDEDEGKMQRLQIYYLLFILRVLEN